MERKRWRGSGEGDCEYYEAEGEEVKSKEIFYYLACQRVMRKRGDEPVEKEI